MERPRKTLPSSRTKRAGIKEFPYSPYLQRRRLFSLLMCRLHSSMQPTKVCRNDQQIRLSLPSPGYLNQGGTKLDSGRVEGLAWGQKYTQAPSKKQHNPQGEEQIKKNFITTQATASLQQRGLSAGLYTDHYHAAAADKATSATIVSVSAYCVAPIRRCRNARPRP